MIATTGGLLLSFTRARNLEGAGHGERLVFGGTAGVGCTVSGEFDPNEVLETGCSRFRGANEGVEGVLNDLGRTMTQT